LDRGSIQQLASQKEIYIELLKLTDEGEQILQYIQDLEINENEPEKSKRIEEDSKYKYKKSKKEMSFQKQQQPQSLGSRLPYRRYYTESNSEIQVSSSGLRS
jgi:pyruvate carboxylase